MIMFDQDTMIIPKETAHFGYYKDASQTDLVSLEQQKIYTEDWIGLKALNEAGKVQRLVVQGEHLQISNAELKSMVVDQF